MQKLTERGLAHSLKKAPGSKKRKKNATDSLAPEVAGPVNGAKSKSSPALNSGSTSRTSTPVPTVAAGIKNAATAMLTTRVIEEQNDRQKRRKQMAGNETLQSLFTSSSKHQAKDGDFMTRGFTMPTGARR